MNQSINQNQSLAQARRISFLFYFTTSGKQLSFRNKVMQQFFQITSVGCTDPNINCIDIVCRSWSQATEGGAKLCGARYLALVRPVGECRHADSFRMPLPHQHTGATVCSGNRKGACPGGQIKGYRKQSRCTKEKAPPQKPCQPHLRVFHESNASVHTFL